MMYLFFLVSFMIFDHVAVSPNENLLWNLNNSIIAKVAQWPNESYIIYFQRRRTVITALDVVGMFSCAVV
jgi:hypothetical protein